MGRHRREAERADREQPGAGPAGPDQRPGDRALIRQLVEQYAVAADSRDGDLYAAVFCDDGVLATPKGEVRGRDALRSVPGRLGRYTATLHAVGSHHVAFDGGDADRAAGRTFCVASHHYDVDGDLDGGGRVYVMMIRYDDEYRRTGAGWRIAARRLTLLWDEDHPTRT